MDRSTLNRWLPLFGLAGVGLTVLVLSSLFGAPAGIATAMSVGASNDSSHDLEQLPKLVAMLRDLSQTNKAAETLRTMVVRWRSLDQQTANLHRLALMELLAKQSIASTPASRATGTDLCELLLVSTLEIPADQRSTWLKQSKQILHRESEPNRGGDASSQDTHDQLPQDFFTPPVLPRMTQ